MKGKIVALMNKADEFRSAVLQTMFEFGLPYTDCSLEEIGRNEVRITFSKDDHSDSFQFVWNGAQFIFLGIVGKHGVVEEYQLCEPYKQDEKYRELISKMLKFFGAVSKAMTDLKHKDD